MNLARHAPRERVSWNFLPVTTASQKHVTLHVSVWVEMPMIIDKATFDEVTLHVSVWVEISDILDATIFLKSRSTWACELKYLR